MAHVNKNIDQNREKISVYRLYFVVNRINAEQHVYFINKLMEAKGKKEKNANSDRNLLRTTVQNLN